MAGASPLSFWNSIYCGASPRGGMCCPAGAMPSLPRRCGSSGRTVLGLVLAVTVAATIPALWLSSRCFVGPAEPLPELSAQQQAAAQNLTALGMDESLVQALSPEELDRCAGAVSVQRAVAFQNGEDTPERQQLEDGTAGELSAYLVELPDGDVRLVLLVRPEGAARTAHPGGVLHRPQRELRDGGLRRPAGCGTWTGRPRPSSPR